MPIRPRTVGVAAALVLLLGACGGDGRDGYEEADAVLRAIGQDAQAITTGAPEECTRTVTTDEYGFETEVFDCPPDVEPDPGVDGSLASLLADDADLPVGTLSGIIEVLGSSPARTALTAVDESLQQLDRSCGVDIARWRRSLEDLVVQSDALLAALEEPPDELDGTAEAAAIGRALVERVILQTGCDQPGVGASIPEAQLVETGTLDLTARASGTVLDIERRLSGSPQTTLFYLYSEIQYGWMRTLREPLDVVVLGSSQAGDGADLSVLAEGLDAEVGNAYLPGALAEVQQHWVPEVERLADPEVVLWYVGALDLLADCDVANRADDLRVRRGRLGRAFAPSGWFGAVDPLAVLLGPVGPRDALLGDVPKSDDVDPGQIAAQTDTYAPQVADATFCTDRAALIADTARDLAGSGRTVHVIGVPTSPRFVDLIDGGLDRVHEAMDRLRSEYLEIDGVHVMDLTGSIQDSWDSWRDLTHMTARGSARFSSAVADALRGAGFRP